MADTRTNRQIMQDTDASARRTASAAQYSAVMQTIQVAQLAQSNALHEIAIVEQQKTNDYLHTLDEQVSGVTEHLRNQAQLLEQQNKSLQQLNIVANDINHGLTVIGNKIDKQTEVIRKGIASNAAWQFAQWRQTPDGKKYIAWAKRAEQWSKIAIPSAQQIEQARHKDACNYATSVLYARRDEFSDDKIPYDTTSIPEPILDSREPYTTTGKDIGILIAQIATPFICAAIWYFVMKWALGLHSLSSAFVEFFYTLVRIALIIPGAIFMIFVAWVGIGWLSEQTDKTAYEQKYEESLKKYKHDKEEYKKKVHRHNIYNDNVEKRYRNTVFPQLRDEIFITAYRDFMSNPVRWSKHDFSATAKQVAYILKTAQQLPPDVDNLPELPEITMREVIDLPQESYYTQDALAQIRQRIASK